MDQASESRGKEFCARCKVAIDRNARRCPHCKERVRGSGKAPIYSMGVAGLLALIFVGWLMVRTIDTSAGDQPRTVQQPAPTPDRQPPLNK
jgi:hypothetical protein